MVLDKKLQWKPVEINVDGDFEGLIGIEEIADYNIERFTHSSEGKQIIIQKDKKSKKGSKGKQVKQNEFVEEEIKLSNLEETDYYPWNNIFVPQEVSQALLEKGFKEPTEIQRLAIPPAVRGKRDILGAAETGSGKTLAFAIPIIYGILKNLEKCDSDEEKSRLWALVLTPTRELAIQVKEHIQLATKHTQLKVAVIVGGMSSEKQTRLLRRKPEIVVATPGRLWDLMSTDDPHLAQIENIRYLVIDETDRMVEANHFPELRSLLLKINADPEKLQKRQTFIFSATLSLIHQLPSYIDKRKHGKKKKDLTPQQKLEKLIKVIGITNPKVIDVTKKTGTATGLTEAKIATMADHKDFYLHYLLAVYPGRTLVFCNSISCVRRLASLMTALDLNPLPLHANMQQRQRLKNLDKFKADDRGLLLATDVAARGLDIPAVEHVIHYQVPRTSETYVHRSGRTARGDRTGVTVMLVDPNEAPLYSRICTTLAREKDVPDFDVNLKVLKEVKERVKLAREIDKISLELKKERSEIGWIEKSAEELDLILDDDQLPSKSNDFELAKKRRNIDHTRKRLKKLLEKSLALSPTDNESGNSQNLGKKVKIFKKRKTN